MSIDFGDLGQIINAFGLIAKAPVASYPQSGEFALAEETQSVGKNLISYDAQQDARRKAASKKRKGSVIRTGATVAGSFFGPAGAAVGSAAGNVAADSMGYTGTDYGAPLTAMSSGSSLNKVGMAAKDAVKGFGTDMSPKYSGTTTRRIFNPDYYDPGESGVGFGY